MFVSPSRTPCHASLSLNRSGGGIREGGWGCFDWDKGIGVFVSPYLTPCHATLSLNREGLLVAESLDCWHCACRCTVVEGGVFLCPYTIRRLSPTLVILWLSTPLPRRWCARAPRGVGWLVESRPRARAGGGATKKEVISRDRTNAHHHTCIATTCNISSLSKANDEGRQQRSKRNKPNAAKHLPLPLPLRRGGGGT